jgi:hypothetical protein
MNTTEINEQDERTPYQLAIDNLSNPKQKLSGRMRRKFQQTRVKVSPYVFSEKKDWEEKLKKNLLALPLHRLIRRLKSYARHSATCVHLLKRLDPQSRFRPPIEQRGMFWAQCFQFANNERIARAQRCKIPQRSSIPHKVQKKLVLDGAGAFDACFVSEIHTPPGGPDVFKGL